MTSCKLLYFVGEHDVPPCLVGKSIQEHSLQTRLEAQLVYDQLRRQLIVSQLKLWLALNGFGQNFPIEKRVEPSHFHKLGYNYSEADNSLRGAS